MSYIRTFSGVKFFPLAPHPRDVRLVDIAHALSFLPRWGGHTARRYSVAQHSLHCERVAQSMGLSLEERISCLMHDATEAYLLDLPRPLKRVVVGYSEAEKQVWGAIRQWFSLPDLSVAVHVIDAAVLRVERHELFSIRDPLEVDEDLGGCDLCPDVTLRATLCFDRADRTEEEVACVFACTFETLFMEIHDGIRFTH